MKSFFKVIKINILSILAVPLLLISIVAKLFLKALEKSLVLLGVGAAVFGLFLLSLIIKNPWGLLEGLGTALALLLLFGTLILIIVIILGFFGIVATAVFTFIVSVINILFTFLFELSHDAYSALFDICKRDYEELPNIKGLKIARGACLFWHLLRGINIIIITILSFAFPISIIASLGAIVFSLILLNNTIMQGFGIGVFQYLKLFSAIESVFAVLYFSVLLIGTIIVLVSLGVEWGEWGRLLRLSTQDYRKYNDLNQEDIESLNLGGFSFEEGRNLERCQHFMDLINEMFNDFEELQQEASIALNLRQDSALIYNLNEYTSLLGEISKQFKKYDDSIPPDIFEKNFIPLIERASRLVKIIQKNVLHILKNMTNTPIENNTTGFFEGCETVEDLRKRYKALCKVYHPDVGGHEETFKLLKNQYDLRLEAAKTSKD